MLFFKKKSTENSSLLKKAGNLLAFFLQKGIKGEQSYRRKKDFVNEE